MKFLWTLILNTFAHPLTTLAGVIGFLEIAWPQIAAFIAQNPGASKLHLSLGLLVLLIGCWAKHG